MADPDHANIPPPPPPERKAPPFTFYDAERDVYRPQFTALDGRRSHPRLRRRDGSAVRGGEEGDIPDAMGEYCREQISLGRLDVGSDVAQQYVGAGAKIVPVPMAPRAPAPARAKAARRKPPALPGWHGMDAISIEVDHRLVAELTPADGSVVKVGVISGSPASRARLRTGDYVIAIGEYGREVPLAEFDRLRLPAYAQVFVRFHRIGRHRVGESEVVGLKLGRQPGRKKPPWWERLPKTAPGREVESGNDRAAFAGQMAAHPHMPKVAYQILIRLLSYYASKGGAYPSYGTLAADVGCRRRQTARENVRALVWLGVLEVRRGEGRVLSRAADRRGGGVTNRFVFHWPEGWQPPRPKRSSGAP